MKKKTRLTRKILKLLSEKKNHISGLKSLKSNGTIKKNQTN